MSFISRDSNKFNVCVNNFQKVQNKNNKRQDNETVEKTCINMLMTKIFASILNEFYENLSILKSFYNQFTSNAEPSNLYYKSMEARYGTTTVEALAKETLTTSKPSIYYRIKEQVALLTKLLHLLSAELQFTKSTFTTITRFIEDVNRMENDGNFFITNNIHRQKLYKQMTQSLWSEQNLSKQFINKVNENILALKFWIQDQEENGRAEVSYLERWESTRQEQSEIYLKMKEKRVNLRKSMIFQNSNEMLCHSEITTFLEEANTDYQKDIQFWMEKYDQELEEKDNVMFKLRVNIESQSESHRIMKETYEQRQNDMDDWMNYKRKKKEEEERAALEEAAAIKIQAWWRGTMVRKRLGPYRRHKKGKKGGKIKTSKRKK